MNLARFRFSILRCICLGEPFQHVHLLTTRGKSLTADKQYILGTRSHILLCTAMCFSCHQTFSPQTMGKIGIEPIMFTTRERFYRPPQHRQSLPLSHNPDSRVSKVFYVLCLNTRRFGLRQHRLYGRTPLHGLNSTVQLYVLTRRYAAMH